MRISIRERGSIGGWVALQRDHGALTRERVDLALRTTMAGRAAEHIVLKAPSAGAGGDPTSDLARATWLATSAVMSLGLGRSRTNLLWRHAPNPAAALPFVLPREVEAEVADMLADAYAVALALIDAHLPAVVALATRLLEVGELEGVNVEALLRQHHGDQELDGSSSLEPPLLLTVRNHKVS